jgi:hypothetical protein
MGEVEVALLLSSSLVLFSVSTSVIWVIWNSSNCRQTMADQKRLHEREVAGLRSQIEQGNAKLAEQRTTHLAVVDELGKAQEQAVQVTSEFAEQKKRLSQVDDLLNRTLFDLNVESSIVVNQRGFIEKLIERVAVAEGGRTEATELAEYFEKQTNKLRAKNHKLETERMEERSREVGSKVVETFVSHGVASVI